MGKKNKICVYTCVTGDYDNIKEFDEFKEDDIDYYLFTNNFNIKSNFWKVIYIDNDGLDNIRLARKIKILGHEILKKYDVSVWLDGASYPIKPIGIFLKDCCDLNKYCLIGFKHPDRCCIYDEAKACVIYGRENKDVVREQQEFLKSVNYPKKNGLIESAILIRNIHDDNLNKCMSMWFDMICKYSYRDQLSFNYVAYVTNLNFKLLDMKAFDNEYFKRSNHVIKHGDRLKKYRIYFGDDSDIDNYSYDLDFISQYVRRDNLFVIEQIAPVDGVFLKIRLDRIGGIFLKNIYLKEKRINDVIYFEHIYFEDYVVFLGDNPTIIIKTEYKKGDRIIIQLNIGMILEQLYIKIVNNLYHKVINLENNVNLLIKKELEASFYKNMYNNLLMSNSWRITAPIRWISSNFKKIVRRKG